jgi:hypothetical protein
MNHSRLLLLSVFTAFSFLALSCTTLYVPTANQIHMMQEEGEVHLAGGIGVGGAYLHGGYAVTDQVGVSAAFSARSAEDSANDRTEEHTYAEFALNYFGFGTSRLKGELMGGVGLGTGKSNDSRGDFNKPFVQMNTALMSSHLVAGLSFRTGYVNFTRLDIESSSSGSKKSDLFFEPSAFVRMGFSRFMIESQLGIAAPITNADELAFGYEPARFSIGFKVLLNRGN